MYSKNHFVVLVAIIGSIMLLPDLAHAASGDDGLSTAQQKQHLKQYKQKATKPRRSSVKTRSMGRNYSVRGLAAKQNLSKLSNAQISRAMNRAGMRVKNGTHVARRLRERGPRDGIHSLQHFTRALSKATPNHGVHRGEPHTYYRLSRETVLTVNSRGQMTTVLTDKRLANSLKW